MQQPASRPGTTRASVATGVGLFDPRATSCGGGFSDNTHDVPGA